MRLIWWNLQAKGRPPDLAVAVYRPVNPPPLYRIATHTSFFPSFQQTITRKMDINCLRSLLLSKPASPSKKPASQPKKKPPPLPIQPPTHSPIGSYPRDAAVQSLQSQFEAQTTRLRDLHIAQRPKNTTRVYEPKQKEWEAWCAKLPGNTDGAWVTEDKLCLFLEQEVVNRESRASGYQERKAKRKEVWKDGERAKKRERTEKGGVKREGGKEGGGKGGEGEEEEWDEEALDALFNETVRFSVVNSYVSAITELYAWQFNGKASPPPLRGAKLSTVLEGVRRDEDRIRRAEFVDRGLFTIAAGYDVKGLKRAITWCWETAAKMPNSVESYLRTASEHLLGSYCCYPLAYYLLTACH
jgi:hypothetical protein